MKERTYIKKRVCVCRTCQGTGAVAIYRKNDLRKMRPIMMRCEVCEGSGRVTVEGTVEKEVLPYHGEWDERIHTDAEDGTGDGTEDGGGW